MYMFRKNSRKGDITKQKKEDKKGPPLKRTLT